MKGKVEENLPYIRQRLSLRYSIVNTVASKSQSHTQELASKYAEKYDIVLAINRAPKSLKAQVGP